MISTDDPRFFPIVNLIGVILMITVNALANILPINGVQTGELSDQYANLFVPPGWVFSIWGIIYILNIGFVGWSFVHRSVNQELIERIGWWYLVISILNVTWLLFWHYRQIWLSTVAMLLFLLSLIRIHYLIRSSGLEFTTSGKLWVEGTFGVYLGWIAVATVANITAGLISIEWDGFGIGEEVWTSIMLIVVLAVSLFMVIHQHNLWFGLVVIWAVAGIFANQQDEQLIVLASGITIIGSLIAILVRVFALK